MTSQRNYEASDYIGTSAAAIGPESLNAQRLKFCVRFHTRSQTVMRVGLSLLSLQNTGRPETLE